MNNTLNITDNKKELRFETPVKNGIAFITYRLEHGKLALMNTEVPEEAEGKGVAGELAKFAFNFAKEHNKKVLVYCPYILTFLKRYPEFKELVDEKSND